MTADQRRVAVSSSVGSVAWRAVEAVDRPGLVTRHRFGTGAGRPELDDETSALRQREVVA